MHFQYQLYSGDVISYGCDIVSYESWTFFTGFLSDLHIKCGNGRIGRAGSPFPVWTYPARGQVLLLVLGIQATMTQNLK